MGNQKNANGGSDFGLIGFISLSLIGVAFYYTWPFSIVLAVAILLTYATSTSKALLLKASNRILLPVTIGLGLFCFILLWVNIFGGYESTQINNLEQNLLDLRLKTKSWLNISFGWLIIILLLMLAITYFLPMLKPVSGFLRGYKMIQNLVIIMATLTSFTFFSQIPADELVKIEHGQRLKEYRAHLSEGDKIIGEYIAATALKKEIENLDQKQKRLFASIFDSVQTEHLRHLRISNTITSTNWDEIALKVRVSGITAITELEMQSLLALTRKSQESLEIKYKDARSEVLEAIAMDIVNEIDPKLEAETERGEVEHFVLEEQALMEGVPNSLDQRSQQFKVLLKVRKFNLDNKEKAKQALKALEAVFIHAIGLEGTNISDLGGTFIRKIFQEYVLRVYRTNVVKKFNLERNFEKVVASSADLQYFKNTFVMSLFFKGLQHPHTSHSSGAPTSPFTGGVSSRFDVVVNEQKLKSERNSVRSIKNGVSGFGAETGSGTPERSTRSLGG